MEVSYKSIIFTLLLKLKTMAKRKTNRQVLTNLIKELGDVELVILRERILNACEEVIDNKVEITEQMKNHIIHPRFYIETMEKINKLTDFEE